MPQDWFAQFAQPAAPQQDWFSQFAASEPRQPDFRSGVVAEMPTAEDPAGSSWLDSAKRFASNFGSALDPRPALKLLYHGAQALPFGQDPTGSAFRADLQGLGAAHLEQFRKGKAAYDAGDYNTAIGHTIAGAVPLVGPAIGQAGAQIKAGDVAGGLGAASGLIAGIAAPVALKGIKGPARMTVKSPVSTANPKLTEAVAFGERHGIPIDAATATDNPYVRGVQKLADESLGGSLVGQRARAAQATGLATLGEQLAAKAAPGASVTPQLAGQGIKDAVGGKLRDFAGEADAAYSQLRAIEIDPANLRTITPDAPPSSVRFAVQGAPADAIFEGVYADAVATGYTGPKGALVKAFKEKYDQARRLQKEMSGTDAEYGRGALLGAIRKLGGLKTGTVGDFSSNIKGNPSMRGLVKPNGLGLDDMVDQLRQDPKWQAIIETEADLLNVLDEFARDGTAGRAGAIDMEHYLTPVGVTPGARWWEGPQTMALPVDLRGTKAAMKPIYDQLARQYPVMQQQASAGFKALENIVKGPDWAPLSQTDRDLGAIKSIARADLPELRSVSQGLAAGAVKQLDAAVRRAAEGAGPEAIGALDTGRAATKAKYAVADVLDSLRDEPVQAFNKATYAKDAGVAELRQIAQYAPAELPKVGRAFLEDLLGTATKDGGFDSARTIATKWEKLGPETKRLLYRDPGYIHDLDSFFRLSAKIAENPNPSGTAATWAKGGELVLLFTNPATGVPVTLGGALLSKALHSRAGVQLLTKGFRIPAKNTAATAAWATRLSALLGGDHGALQPVPVVAQK